MTLSCCLRRDWPLACCPILCCVLSVVSCGARGFCEFTGWSITTVPGPISLKRRTLSPHLSDVSRVFGSGARIYRSIETMLPVSRQATPSDQVGILSNANVRLDERLDLLDFLETAQTTHLETAGKSRGGVSPWEPPLPSSALDVALAAESQDALQTLHDEVPSIAPVWCQALFCVCFPIVGVEGTMRNLRGVLPEALGARVDSCLQVLDRQSQRRIVTS